MKKFSIKAEKRKLLGRKVKSLREKGLLPGNIFGKKTKSISIQVNAKDFMKIFSDAGETGVVEVELEDEKIPVLVHNFQTHPVLGTPVHVDLLKVNLKEKVTTTVPVELIGESPAVKDKTGVLLKLLNEVEVEALPADLPEKIEVNVEGLLKIDDVLKVSDIKTDAKVQILTDASHDIVKVAPLVSKEAEKLSAEQATAAAAAAAEQTDAETKSAQADQASSEEKKEQPEK